MVIANFVMEIGLESEMPTYSGGLGVLAGDFAFSLADLGVPAVFVTLIYRKGYAMQKLDMAAGQLDSEASLDPGRFLKPLDVHVDLEIGGRPQRVTAWEYRASGKAEVPVLFLDTDIAQNDPAVGQVTDRLYGGDPRYRLEQEMVLGIAGYRMLKALGYDVEVCHLNESHAALLTVELLREYGNRQEVKKRCVFTSHTPLPAAGNDVFPLGMVKEVFAHYDWINWDSEAIEGRVDLSLVSR